MRPSDLAEKNNSTKDSGPICKQNTQFFTSEKLVDLIVTFLLFIQISIPFSFETLSLHK